MTGGGGGVCELRGNTFMHGPKKELFTDGTKIQGRFSGKWSSRG